MTQEQQRALLFIGTYINLNGYGPTYEEIAEGLGIKAKSGVHRIVRALIETHHLIDVGRRQRSLTLAKPPKPTTEQLAKRLAAALYSRYGFDDGDGPVIACEPHEAEAVILAALSQ